MLCERYWGSATSVNTRRVAVFRKARPAFRWAFHSSPSTFMIPCPRLNKSTDRKESQELYGKSEVLKASPPLEETIAPLRRAAHITQGIASSLPKRSHDRCFTKRPLPKSPSFLKTNSRLRGSLMITPGGRVGTDISSVSYPVWRSHLTNHENSFWRACKNTRPLPARGSVSGAFLHCESVCKLECRPCHPRRIPQSLAVSLDLLSTSQKYPGKYQNNGGPEEDRRHILRQCHTPSNDRDWPVGWQMERSRNPSIRMKV